MEQRQHRKIRSFVRRPGRTTAGQRLALKRLMERYGLGTEDTLLDLDTIFGRHSQRILDIGFGDGEALLTSAANNPHLDFLGVEVHEPGIGHLLLLLEQANLDNVRVICRDVVDVLAGTLADSSLFGINLFFPDPWPKKRHHKRRLVQTPIAIEFARVLEPRGWLHIATDWENYAEHIKEVVGSVNAFTPMPEDHAAIEIPSQRPPTKFERRGRKLGHDVWDLVYERRDS
jgi:tRNA (guanine-N7-)-methyltransferase